MSQIFENKGPILGARHLQAFLLFLAIVVNYASRFNISISLVAMTDASTTNPNFPEFNWNEKQKSYILSSFFWGYFAAQLPGSYVARRFGVKTAMLIGTLISSILGLLVPFCVNWGGWEIFCIIRVLMGISQGVLFPCTYQHIAKWSPVEERNRLGAISHSGLECGTIVAMYVTGMIAASNWGWPGIFFVFNGSGIVFCLIWLIFASNSPVEAKFISDAEKNYILNSQASVENDHNKKIKIPWKELLVSGPLISLVVVAMCDTWGYETMLTQIPSFLHGVLKMDINSNAFFSALPYVTMWMFSYVFMISADVVLKNEWISLLMLRKTVNTIATWGPAAFLIGIGFLNENQSALVIICITLSVALNGGHIIGIFLNLIDLSPNHAGVILALTNTLGSIVALVCPIVVGIIVSDETDRNQWQIAFVISAGLFILGNLQFLVFAQADAQSWNDENYSIDAEAENSNRQKRSPRNS